MGKKRASPGTRKKTADTVKPELDADGLVASPIDVHDRDDPGDATQRAYRYQYAYGVILLAGMASKQLAYTSLWCEHHDDFLAQLGEKFDSYQVKTRQPENGFWELTTDGFVAAVKKFAILESRFPGRIANYRFVSNTQVSASNANERRQRSPTKLYDAIAKASDENSIEAPFDKSLATLAKAAGASTACVFAVFKKIGFVKGPSKEDFEAVLSLTHIARMESCNAFPPEQLNAIRDELIQKVYDASSNVVLEPAKHWCCVNGTAADDPTVQAKQLFAEIVDAAVRTVSGPCFRYSPIAAKTDKRLAEGELSTLEKKLVKGGLRKQLETLHRRTVSTEKHLLEIAASRPREVKAILAQLEQTVKGVCADASLETSVDGVVDGRQMLSQVQKELRRMAADNPSMVHGQPYECLVGMAGLLTEECTVWWSEPFDLEEDLV